MSRFGNFLKRERLYILLLVFVAILTAMMFSAPADKIKSSAGDAVKIDRHAAEEKALKDRETLERVFTENKYLAFIFALVSLLVIALFLLGLVIDAIFVIARSSGKKIEISTYKGQKTSWGIWDVSKVVILFLFFGYVLLIIEASLRRICPIVKDDNFRMILNSSIMDALCAVFILHFTVGQYKERLASLGLSLKNFFKNVYYGIVGYIALIPVLIGIIAVIAFIVSVTKYTPPKQPVVELFLKEKDTSFLLYASLFAAIAGPIIEELFFRGFVYNAVKKYIGVFWAALITAAMFAVLHAHLVGFLPILALGILLAYLYEKTGTLVSSITVHMIHNTGMVFLVFLVKKLGVY